MGTRTIWLELKDDVVMFMDHDMRQGLVLQASITPFPKFPIFVDLSVLIADEASWNKQLKAKGHRARSSA